MLDGGRRRRAAAAAAAGLVCHAALFDDVLRILSRCLTELERAMTAAGVGRSTTTDRASISRFIVIIVHLLSLAARLAAADASDDSRRRLRAASYQLVRMNPRATDRRTPLHLAASADTTDVGRYPVARFPDAGAITTLLDAGADIDAFDAQRNTALHLAARSRPVQADIVRLLLDRGAHPDITNSQRLNAEQLIDAAGTDGAPLYTVTSPVSHVTLQCLASRVITRHHIDYHDTLPRRLHAFIQLH